MLSAFVPRGLMLACRLCNQMVVQQVQHAFCSWHPSESNPTAEHTNLTHNGIVHRNSSFPEMDTQQQRKEMSSSSQQIHRHGSCQSRTSAAERIDISLNGAITQRDSSASLPQQAVSKLSAQLRRVDKLNAGLNHLQGMTRTL